MLPAVLIATMLAVALVFLPMIGMRPDFAAAMMRAAVMVKQAVPVLIALGRSGRRCGCRGPAAASVAGRCCWRRRRRC